MAITTKGITMRFGNNDALRGVDIELKPACIYGLLGRNGAGKTTLINLITNRLIPSEGTITIDGEPGMENDGAQAKVFAMGEARYLPDDTKVKQMFKWAQLFYPGFDMAYACELAERFKLPTNKKVKSLSTGYGTISKLVAALASDVPYVLLDEPVLGLDANHRELFYRELLTNFSKKPRTFVLSTHLIGEIQDIVEQVIILHQGKVLLNDSAEEVRRMGYSVSGKAEDVDRYCAGRQVMSSAVLGGLKTASLLGKAEGVPASLQVTPLELQQLFVQLTDAQEEIAS